MKKKYKPTGFKMLLIYSMSYYSNLSYPVSYPANVWFAIKVAHNFYDNILNTIWTEKYSGILQIEELNHRRELLSKKLLYSILCKYKKSHI